MEHPCKHIFGVFLGPDVGTMLTWLHRSPTTLLVFLSLDAAFLGVLAAVWTMAFLASASVFSLSQLRLISFVAGCRGWCWWWSSSPSSPSSSQPGWPSSDSTWDSRRNSGRGGLPSSFQNFCLQYFSLLVCSFLLLHLACKDSEEGKESSFGKAADKWMGENFIFVLKIKKFPDCALTIHVQFVCHHLICKTNCYYWTLSFFSFKGENTLERQPDRGGWWSFLSFTLSYHQWQWLHQESFPNTSNSTISLQSMYDLCGRTPGGK